MIRNKYMNSQTTTPIIWSHNRESPHGYHINQIYSGALPKAHRLEAIIEKLNFF